MIIEQYNEDLNVYINLVHDAAEGRHNLSDYELHVIEAALIQCSELDKKVFLLQQDITIFQLNQM